MKNKTRFALSMLGLALALAACSAALNGCGGQTDDREQISALADLDSVEIIQADETRQPLPAPEQAVLAVGEGVDVDEAGRAILQFSDLLTVEVLRDGALRIEQVAVDEQNAFITIFQNGGLLLNDFEAQAEIDKRFTINTEFASITAVGTRFIVYREPGSPLEWVMALDAAPGDLLVTATDSGATKEVQTNVARWIAPIGEPSPGITADLTRVQQWLAGSQAGTNQENFGDIVWEQADVLGDSRRVVESAPAITPAPGVTYTFQGVGIRLGESGQYAQEDCNFDGLPDIAVQGGEIEFDFRNVLARVRALDVTVLVRAGQARLTVLDPARAVIETQSALAAPDTAQVLSLRHQQPYHYATLALDDGCFLGFSLTPSITNAEAPPRAAVEQLQVAEPFVRIDTPLDGQSLTQPLTISGEASVPDSGELVVRIEQPDGSEIQTAFASVVGGEYGAAPGTFTLTLEVDALLPAELVIRVQNFQNLEIPVLLAEAVVRVTLNPPTPEIVRRPPENGEFFAPGVVDAITVDGFEDDWFQVMEETGLSLLTVEQIVYDEACFVFFPYGIPGPEAEVDLEAEVAFAYDLEHLYALFIVQDESFAPYRGESTFVFLGDAPQLILDLDLAGDFSDSSNSRDDVEFDLHPGFAFPSEDDDEFPHEIRGAYAVYWNLGDFLEIGVQASQRDPRVIVDSRLTSDGYVLEAAIPWEVLGVSPQPGATFGIAASVSDNDDPESDAQQCMISSAPARDFRNPQTWGTLFLGE